MKRYNKLVRDGVPDIIKKKGERVEYHIANDAEYKVMLRNKLIEEMYEFLADESIEELADIMEVVHAMMTFHSFSYDEVDQKIREKREARGGFTKRFILDKS